MPCNNGRMTKIRPVRHARPTERRLPLRAPVRAWALAEWALLPLRLFLGVTFCFAGLQKLSNPNFFNSQSPNSIQAQLIAAARISPIHSLLSHLVQFASPIGIVIALSELAIGVGALVGLWTRIAAVGGAVLSFSLFLTVSFHATPYYTGADLVFFFAWLSFIFAGSGSRLSLDGLIANRVAKEHRLRAPEIVAIPFASVQQICGHFRDGQCSAREGLACEAAVCPVLLGDRAPLVTRVSIDQVDRRAIILGGAAAVAVGVTVVIGAAATAAAGRLVGGVHSPASTARQLGGGSTTTTTPGSAGPASNASGTLLGPAKEVPVGNAAQFTINSSGDPGIVIQPTSGQFVAYDAVCPHAGCTVGYYAANNILVCPCHGSEFLVSSGAVVNGPAPHGLTKLKVVAASDGNLYLQ